jgi:hypothetical protein
MAEQLAELAFVFLFALAFTLPVLMAKRAGKW